MTHLDAQLLGDIRLRLDRSPVEIRSAKARALFCYLLATRQVHSRDRLAGFFWPEVPEGKALASLRTALYEVRRALGPASARYLVVDRTRISFSSAAAYTLDIEAVEAVSPERGEAGRGALEAAVAAYGGEFLAGLSVADSYDFEDWVFLERERLAQLVLGALCRLGRVYAAERDYERAVATARRVLAVDPLREDVHRSLMEYLTYAGRRSEALIQFATCRRLLQDELGIEPLASTSELHRRILADELAPDDRTQLEDAVPGPSIPVVAPAQEPAVARAAAERCAVDSRNPLAAIRASAPFVGRDREMALLREAWVSAQGGRPALVALQGEAGIGKTRLLAEAVGSLGDAAVVAGRCHESDGSRPYAPIVAALRSADRGGLLAGLDLDDLWRRELARLLPEWAAKSPRLNAPLDGQRDRDRLFEAVRVAVAAMAERRPVVLVVDDCQWADETSLSLLGYLARGLGSSRCLVVLAWRPEELTPQRRSSLRSLAALGRLVALGPLGAGDTAGLVQALAEADHAPEHFAARLHAKTGGNPFFVLETLSALFEQGTLSAVDGAWATTGGLADRDYGSLPVPASVGLLIDSRLDRLTDDARGLLECAAVLRRDFRFDLVQAASTLPAAAALDALDLLLAQGLVREVARRGPSAARYDFVHALVRDRVYEGLSGARRQFLHRQVAGLLEAGDDPAAERVAYHYTRGGVRERACAWLLRAGASALGVYAAEDAAGHFRGARELAVSPTEEHAALVGMGDALMLLGRGADAVAAFEDALATTGAGAERAEILRRVGRAHERSGAFDLALEAFEGARSSLGDSLEGLAAARVADGLATVYVRLGRPAEAVALCSEALGWNLGSGATEAEAWLRNTLGMAYLYAGDVPASLAQLERSLALKRQLGDRLGEATLLNNIGVVYYRTGDDPRARDHYAASCAAKEAIGDRYGTAIALVNLALMDTHLGAFEEAEGHLALAKKRAQAVDATWLMPEIHRVAAQRAMAVGDFARARDEATGALEAAESLGVPAFIGVAHRVLGLVKAGEESGAAEEHFETSLAVFEMLEDEHELAKTHEAYARALLAGGRQEAAAVHATAAAEVFRRSGAQGRLSRVERLLGG